MNEILWSCKYTRPDSPRSPFPSVATEGGDVQLFSVSEILAFHMRLSDVQGMQEQVCPLQYCLCHLLVN